MVADGEVKERGLPGDLPYRNWTAGMVLKEMQKAGWRLADLLEKTLRPNDSETPQPAASSSPPPVETPSAR